MDDFDETVFLVALLTVLSMLLLIGVAWFLCLRATQKDFSHHGSSETCDATDEECRSEMQFDPSVPQKLASELPKLPRRQETPDAASEDETQTDGLGGKDAQWSSQDTQSSQDSQSAEEIPSETVEEDLVSVEDETAIELDKPVTLTLHFEDGDDYESSSIPSNKQNDAAASFSPKAVWLNGACSGSGKRLCMMIDSGASCSLIDQKEWKTTFGSPNLEAAEFPSLVGFNEQSSKVAGKFPVRVIFNGARHTLPLVVVCGEAGALCGRSWMNALMPGWQQKIKPNV